MAEVHVALLFVLAVCVACCTGALGASAGASVYAKCTEPAVIYPTLFPHFLTDEECDTIVAEAQEQGMERSTVIADDPISSSRTSKGTFLSPQESKVTQQVMSRVATLLHMSPANFEKLQVVSYDVGDKYEAHYDAKEGLLRKYTVLIYLTDDFEGGHTVFPHTGFSIRPHKGLAVAWKNIDDSERILPCSYHEAQPVTAGPGKKFACNIWARTTPLSA